MNTQGGDPAKLADPLVDVIALDEPPARFASGADAVGVFERTAQALIDHANALRGCPPTSPTTTPEPARPSLRRATSVEPLSWLRWPHIGARVAVSVWAMSSA